MIRLLELRTEKALSQRQMAKVLNISQGTYNNWENENTQPSVEQLIQIAKFFEVSVDYLIGNSQDFDGMPFIKPLSKREEQLLSAFGALNEEQQNSLISFLNKISVK